MKIRSFFILILALASMALAAEEWVNYSNPFPIWSSIPIGDGVLMATDGGIRYRSPQGDDLYTSRDGLESSKIYALASTSLRGVFAVSEDGSISTMSASGRWTVVSRAYAGSNLRVLPDMTRMAGSTLIIAFSDRLSFFDLNNLVSVITIDQISNVSLIRTPVTAMEVKGDSLYVATGGSLFVRKMDWDHMADDFRLSDPGSWKLVKEEGLIRSIAWKGETLKTFPYEGHISWDGDKIEYSVFDDTSLVVVDGKTLKDKILYSKEPVIKYDTVFNKVNPLQIDFIKADTLRFVEKNLIKWASKLPSGGTMLVGEMRVYYYDGSKLNDMTDNASFRLGNAYELQVMPHGGVFAASVQGNFAFNAGVEWSGNIDAWIDGPTKMGNFSDATAHNLRELSMLADGTVLYHIWGLGFFLYSDWGQERFYSGYSKDESCLRTYKIGDNYLPLAVSTTRAPDNSGFLTATASDSGYALVYIKPNGEMTCADGVGKSKLAGPIVSRIDPETGKWIVYAGTREAMSKTSDGGLDVIRFASPKTTGGYISIDSVKHYGGYSTTPIDMAYDSKSGFLWIATASALEYWDEDQDSLRMPFSTNGLTGASFTSLDVDVRGNIWMGTSGQGVYRLTPRKSNPDTLSVKHFTTRNGLLSDEVLDVAVDSVIGAAWFAHANGVSLYRRSDLKSAADNMTSKAKLDVKVYPNPFRMHEQSYVAFDNIAEDAVVSIYNGGGNLVRSLHGEALQGGRVEWDGKDKRGKEVTPGVYHYVVKTSSDAKKGKLIVVR